MEKRVTRQRLYVLPLAVDGETRHQKEIVCLTSGSRWRNASPVRDCMSYLWQSMEKHVTRKRLDVLPLAVDGETRHPSEIVCRTSGSRWRNASPVRGCMSYLWQ